MKTLVRIAVIAFAGLGVLAQAQAQEYTNKLNAAKPKLDALMQSMKYGEAAETVRAMLPAEVPDFPKDPANPMAARNNFYEMGSLQDLHEYLYKALLASGDKEGAVACIKRAEEIAQRNAADTEEGLAPTIDSWATAVEVSTKNLEEAAPIKEQLEAAIAQLESKPKRKKKEDEALAKN
jgi:hypothetical protein